MRWPIAILALLPVVAQAGSPATEMRQRYEECAWTSLMLTPQQGVEPNFAAEKALAACQTEEQALAVYLANIAPGQAATILISLKLRIKKDLVQAATGLR